MVVLFLDMDGVANSLAFMSRQSAANLWDFSGVFPDGSRDWSNMIDPHAVGLLNDIVAATGAKIVISSSWRLALTKAEIVAALRKRGFRGEIIDATPHCSGEPRSFEIAAWLNHRGVGEVTRFAIVDDDLDAGIGMGGHFVKTVHAVGITRADANRLIRILS